MFTGNANPCLKRFRSITDCQFIISEIDSHLTTYVLGPLADQLMTQSTLSVRITPIVLFLRPMQQEAGPTPIPASGSKPVSHPERITQMQCLETNSSLNLFFVESISEAFKYLPSVLAKIYKEIELLVNFLEYRLTVSVDRPLPGDQLQNIQFTQSALTQHKKILYLLFTVILPYIKSKVQTYLVDSDAEEHSWKAKLLRVLNYMDKVLSLLSFVNLSIFIVKGKYRTIIQRVLRMPMEFIDSDNQRVLNFSLMNRRVIWSIYELFIKTILPYASGFVGTALKNVFYLNSYLEVEDQNTSGCMVCQNEAVMPLKGKNCDHVGCYYCIKSRGEQEDEKCLTCRAAIEEWQQLYS